MKSNSLLQLLEEYTTTAEEVEAKARIIEFIKTHESKELRWVDKNIDMFPTKERSVLRMFEKWVKIS